MISTVADGARSVYASDLDGDGDVDVLSASAYDDKIAWYENYTVTATPGDLSGDGFVGRDDLNIIMGNWGSSVTPGDWSAGDSSGDGFVGGDDLNIVLGNWGAGTPPSLTGGDQAAQGDNGEQGASEAGQVISQAEQELPQGGAMRLRIDQTPLQANQPEILVSRQQALQAHVAMSVKSTLPVVGVAVPDVRVTAPAEMAAGTQADESSLHDATLTADPVIIRITATSLDIDLGASLPDVLTDLLA